MEHSSLVVGDARNLPQSLREIFRMPRLEVREIGRAPCKTVRAFRFALTRYIQVRVMWVGVGRPQQVNHIAIANSPSMFTNES